MLKKHKKMEKEGKRGNLEGMGAEQGTTLFRGPKSKSVLRQLLFLLLLKLPVLDAGSFSHPLGPPPALPTRRAFRDCAPYTKK